MAARKITAEQIALACEMRERGKSFSQIARYFAAKGQPVSEGTISWHCLINGADAPPAKRQQSRHKPGAIVRRGNHLVRFYTPEEDARLLAMEMSGARVCEIARALNRKPNSIRGRLATLARHDARAEHQ